MSKEIELHELRCPNCKALWSDKDFSFWGYAILYGLEMPLLSDAVLYGGHERRERPAHGRDGGLFRRVFR